MQNNSLKTMAMLSLPLVLTGCFFVKAPNADRLDSFGSKVSITDKILVVSAHHEQSADNRINGNMMDNSLNGAGAAYIYLNHGDKWYFQTYLKPSNTHATQIFGSSVDVAPDNKLIAIGAYNDFYSGAVFMFQEDAPNNWSEQAKIVPGILDGGDDFGYSLALSGDGSTMVIGAPRNDSASDTVNIGEADNSDYDAGAAYVFKRNGDVWYQVAFLKPYNPDANDHFGWAVDINYKGNVIVIGASHESSGQPDNGMDNSCSLCGAAYIFEHTGASLSDWTLTAYLKDPTPRPDKQFGFAVAIDDAGTRVAVGAPDIRYHITGKAPSGSDVHIFKKTHSLWNYSQRLMPSHSEITDDFGYSLDFSPNGQYLLVGDIGDDSSAVGVDMPDDNSRAHTDSGAAYLFQFDGYEYEQKHYIKSIVSDPKDYAGISVAMSNRKATFGILESSKDNNDPRDNSLLYSGAAIALDLVDDLGLPESK